MHLALLASMLFSMLFGIAGVSHAGESQPPDPFRALWVTRWDYRTEADVKRAVSEAASLGVTDLIWQVRGQADAYYKSALEPWGEELLRDLPPGTKEPKADPLAIAVSEAHARGMKLHAWVNVMPLWKGTTPPKSMVHPFYLHPWTWGESFPSRGA